LVAVGLSRFLFVTFVVTVTVVGCAQRSSILLRVCYVGWLRYYSRCRTVDFAVGYGWLRLRLLRTRCSLRWLITRLVYGWISFPHTGWFTVGYIFPRLLHFHLHLVGYIVDSVTFPFCYAHFSRIRALRLFPVGFLDSFTLRLLIFFFYVVVVTHCCVTLLLLPFTRYFPHLTFTSSICCCCIYVCCYTVTVYLVTGLQTFVVITTPRAVRAARAIPGCAHTVPGCRLVGYTSHCWLDSTFVVYGCYSVALRTHILHILRSWVTTVPHIPWLVGSLRLDRFAAGPRSRLIVGTHSFAFLRLRLVTVHSVTVGSVYPTFTFTVADYVGCTVYAFGYYGYLRLPHGYDPGYQ